MFETLAITVVGGVVGSLLSRRYPAMSRPQLFAAVAAIAGSVLIMGRPGGNDSALYYISATIAVSMGTFLIMTWLPRRITPSSGS